MSKSKSPKPDSKTPNNAFRRADDGYKFLGKKLQPFSFLRQSALISLSLEMGVTRSVEIAAAMWLMSNPDAVVKKARRNPIEFMDQVDAYAEKNGLGAVAGNNYAAAQEVFDRICEDVKLLTGTPPNADDEHEDDESGN